MNYIDQDYPSDPTEVFSVTCDGMPSVFGPAGVELLSHTMELLELQSASRPASGG